ncbi:MAG: hypothetical protein ACR2PG_07180, partial [Hyphomicrobiaceae bacterium]
EVALIFSSSVIGVVTLACSIQGYMWTPLGWIWRAVLAGGAVALLMPDLKLKLVGFAIIMAAVIVQQLGQSRESAAT